MPKRKRKRSTQQSADTFTVRVPDLYRLGLVASGHLVFDSDTHPAATRAVAAALLEQLDEQGSVVVQP